MSKAPKPIPADEENVAAKYKRVLLLEDDEMLKTAIKEYLETNFYEVVGFPTARKACARSSSRNSTQSSVT